MTRLWLLIYCCLSFTFIASAQDVTDLQRIGPVVSFTRSDKSVTLNCQDNSQVQITPLAPDLVRVRASFTKPIPARDHSWAIAKEVWTTPRWTVVEKPTSIVITTDEVEVVINRSPLLIEFRNARTHEVINSDEQPMAYDAKGLMVPRMFDPKAGTYVAAAKKLGFDEHFYGLGEKAARLDKRRSSFINWNSDTPGYQEGTDPIYQTIPFYIGLKQGTAYGIFFDNSYRSYFDFGKSSQQRIWFGAEGGEMNYYFFYGPSIKKILGRYAELTGHMPLPPMWALGNQQSRWSYYPDAMVEEVARQYRQRDLPLDVIHLDIHYMHGYRVFTWDRKNFPAPAELTKKLASQGVKVVTIVDPGIKYQPAAAGAVPPKSPNPEHQPQGDYYYVFEEGLKNNYFQRRKNGDLFVPRVWPGDSVFVDYTLPDARAWWGQLHRAYVDHGVDGIWTDMNEPSDFVDQTGKNQMDVVSYDEGEKSTHAKNRNVFALLMARATYEGLERLQPDRRPYVITRAAYAGIQRYSTMWTGDSNSTWEALALSIPMFQSLGLSGEPFVGSDVGGFQAQRSNGELLVRSYQVSFLAPFCRNHKVIDGYDQEPWRFGRYYEDIIRKYLKLRYELLPFLYTTLEEAHRTGVPVFRPLLLNYQGDDNTYNLDDQFMIGTDLLVAPVLRPGQTRRLVYLPQGDWYDYWTNKKQAGGTMIEIEAPLETVPMFVRAGAIIPKGPVMSYVGEKPSAPQFVIYPDEKGNAETTLYEDDGLSPAYKKGVFRRTRVRLSKDAGRLILKVDAPEGTFQPGSRTLEFSLPLTVSPVSISVDGDRILPMGRRGMSWSKRGSMLVIRMPDDGKSHSIEIR